MNTKHFVTFLLLLPLAFGGGYWAARRSAAQSTATSTSPGKSAPTGGEISKPAEVPGNAGFATFDWRVVESDDYRKYIANLRAIGCPEKTIRDIIIADVNELFAQRRKALASTTNLFEFWKADAFKSRMPDPRRVREEQTLAQEKRALLKELLGIEPEVSPELATVSDSLASRLDFLPAGKRVEVTDLLQRFQAKMRQEVRADGFLDPEERKQIQKANKELAAELAQILTPQELQDYELRVSETADQLRHGLRYFDPTAEEFRDIFTLQKKFDDEFYCPNGPNVLSKAERDSYLAAKKQLEAQLRNILGETRYADYERAHDGAYWCSAKVAEQQGLPKESAVQVYDLNRMAVEAAARLRNDPALSSEQRAAALQGILTETERSIRAIFGDKGFETYQQQHGVILFQMFGANVKKSGNS